jgi:hypothetical protein
MIYDLLTDPSLQIEELLNAVGATGSADPDEKIAGWVHQVIALLETDPATNNALITLVGTVLEEDNADRLLPALIEMADDGVLVDLKNIVERELTPCSQLPIGASP